MGRGRGDGKRRGRVGGGGVLPDLPTWRIIALWLLDIISISKIITIEIDFKEVRVGHHITNSSFT